MVESARVSCGNYYKARLSFEAHGAYFVSKSDLLFNSRTSVNQEEQVEQEPARTQK